MTFVDSAEAMYARVVGTPMWTSASVKFSPHRHGVRVLRLGP